MPPFTGTRQEASAPSVGGSVSVDELDFAPVIGGEGVDAIVQLTQAEYDALDPPVATTLYVIVG